MSKMDISFKIVDSDVYISFDFISYKKILLEDFIKIYDILTKYMKGSA